MALGVLAVLLCLPRGGNGGSFAGSYVGFLAAFVVLFVASGIGNGSAFRMIPLIFLAERQRAAEPTPSAQAQAVRDGNREGAAALGFASAVGAYGGFFIPKSYGTSIALTGGPEAALAAFVVFYLSCLAITWWYYARQFAPMPC
jgi:NNP family nitrate/nitrite transporter-like MFS transporter